MCNTWVAIPCARNPVPESDGAERRRVGVSDHQVGAAFVAVDQRTVDETAEDAGVSRGGERSNGSRTKVRNSRLQVVEQVVSFLFALVDLLLNGVAQLFEFVF